MPYRIRSPFPAHFALLPAFLLLATLSRGSAAVDVLTYHYDLARTGLNDSETQLTLNNVNSGTFGKVFSYPVDGYTYSQPLILNNVSIPGQGIHNVVFVATQHDSVFAFDADNGNGANAQPLWHVSFINPAMGITTVPSGDTGSGDIVPEIGITGTPVIDPDSKTIYVEAKTKENGAYVHRLHALDVASGAERPGSPVVVSGSVKGSGDGNDGRGNVPFIPLRQQARPALTLFQPPGYTNKAVFVAYTSHGDNSPYHGWVFAYDATTLRPLGIFNANPNGGLCGIWMSGNGLAVDPQGRMFCETGNGSYGPAAGNYGDSFIRIEYNNSNVQLTDYFTPYNQAALSGADTDLGSGGSMILPDAVGSTTHPHLLIGSGKEGRLYLVDRDNMGHFNAANDNQIVQWLGPGTIGGAWSSPAYYRGRIYYQGVGDVMKAFGVTNAHLASQPLMLSQTAFGFPGATPVISANGFNNAIAWVIQSDGYGNKSPAVLHAYNADNLQQELYNSAQAGLRDQAGPSTKFTVPVVANGKVYVGTGTELDVYGVGQWLATPIIQPNGAIFATNVTVTITDSSTGAAIYYTTDGTTPTTNSIRYQNPFIVSKTTAINARAFAPGQIPSSPALATFFAQSSIGNGTGLRGQYWANHLANFTGNPTLTRTDSTVNFDWNNNSPDPSIPTTDYSVKWTGYVQPQFNETYTFYITVDDGGRLFVDGVELINGWVDQAPTQYSGSIALTAGKHTIEMDYYQNGGGAVATLSWSSPSTPMEIIPQSQLYLPILPPVVGIKVTPDDPVIAGPASITLDATATSPNSIITQVSFALGSKAVGTITNPPYSVTLTDLAPNVYTVTATATDGNGNSTTTPATLVTVGASTNSNLYGVASRPQFKGYLNLPTNPAAALPPLLSQTGAFADTQTLVPSPSLIPYTVADPFWSDGAIKLRWLAVPFAGGINTPSNQIAFSQDSPWVYPVGSSFVKHFSLVTNEITGGTQRLETRILVYAGQGAVYGASYRWRPDGSDADLVTGSQTENITITTAGGVRNQQWYFPAQADCIYCHNTVAGGILGASKTRQLNFAEFYHTANVTDNQLRTLNHLGVFYPAIDESSIASLPHYSAYNATNASVEDRARSFLDVNCAYCHQPGGPGRAVFDLRITTPLDQANLINGSVAATFGIPGARALIPGDLLRSVVYYRVGANDPVGKMPPIARNTVDTADLNVLGEWIDALYGPAPQLQLTNTHFGDFLIWPATPNPFYLQTISDPLAADDWVAGPAARISTTLRATNFVAPVSITNSSQFYRLTSQAPLP